MCLGVVGVLETNSGQHGVVNVNGLRMPVNLALLPGAKSGDFVLVHAGFALKKVVYSHFLVKEKVQAFLSHSQTHTDKIIAEIKALALNLLPLTIMEVCGTHTVSIARYGIKTVLPSNIRLVSGPGCPVCVTPTNEIDTVIKLAQEHLATIATFGDMLRVPGSFSSLEEAKAQGAEVKVVYSPEQALLLAQNLKQEVVFLAIGFETTAPLIAQIIKKAASLKLKNFSVFLSHRLIPPALDALLSFKDIKLDGLILPGHVSTVIGLKAYRQLQKKYQLPMVVAGFSFEQILLAIREIVSQKAKGKVELDSVYKTTVTEEGNLEAQRLLTECFTPVGGNWRGLGFIPQSALSLKDKWAAYDAKQKFNLTLTNAKETPGCLCAKILIGAKTPKDCSLFSKVCTPENPQGPCMVSSEGSCQAEYIYGAESEEQLQSRV